MRETPALPEADATDLLSAGAHGPDRMDAVFARLFSSYGRAFLDQFTAGRTHGGRDVGVELAKSEWRRALAEFEDDSLLRACDQLREACRWPPNLADMLAAVRLPPAGVLADYYATAQRLLRLRQACPGADDGQWPTRALFWAALRYGAADVMSTPWERARERFGAVYASLGGKSLAEVPSSAAPRISEHRGPPPQGVFERLRRIGQ